MGSRKSFEYYYDTCSGTSYDKNQLFIGFCDKIVKGTTKCKLFCKNSNLYWETTSVEKHIRRCGCSCKKCSKERSVISSSKPKEEYIQKIKDSCTYYNSEFLGFKGGLYKGVLSHVIQRCKEHLCTWDTTEARALVKRDMVTSGCKECKAKVMVEINNSKEEDMVSKILSRGSFKKGTVMWRSDRTTLEGTRNYWKYRCPECSFDEYVENGLCSGVFEIFNGGECDTSLGCRCSKGYRWSLEQKEYNLNKVIKQDGIEFITFNKVDNNRVDLNCQECNHKWSPLYYNVLCGGNRCPVCSRHNSNWGLYKSRLEEEDLLYVMVLTGNKEAIVKIGRSFILQQRIRDLNKFYDVLFLGYHVGKHKEVFYKEKEIHRLLKDYNITPVIEFGGYTECFTMDVLNLREVITLFNL